MLIWPLDYQYSFARWKRLANNAFCAYPHAAFHESDHGVVGFRNDKICCPECFMTVLRRARYP